MFNLKTFEKDNNKYLVKEINNKIVPIGILHNKKFRTTINIPEINNIKELKDISKTDIEQIGYMVNKNSFLQVLNTNYRIDNSFLLEDNCYVQNSDIAKNIANYSYNKQKGLIIFEHDKEFQKYFKEKNIEFDYYSENNLKINIYDLNENILMDLLSLSSREQSVIASIMYYKEQNKENKKVQIPVLDGSNWLYDLFIMEPKFLANQFRVSEYNIKILKTSILKLKVKKIISDEFSNINEIVKKAENGKIILIDVKDEDKKLVKLSLSTMASSKLIVMDNIYQKTNNMQYVLYDANIFDNSIDDFKSFIINRYGFNLKSSLIDIHLYEDYLLYLDFEYLVIKKGTIPIIVTNEDYIKSEVVKTIKTTSESLQGFF